MKGKSFLGIAGFVLVLATACKVQREKSAALQNGLAATFTNPIADGADPWVIKDGNTYYTCRGLGNGIAVGKSDKLTQPGKPVKVWTAPATGWNSHNIWAPELHKIGKRWYIYYAAGKAGPPFIHQRSGVLESVTGDPQGAWIDKGVLNTGTDAQDSTGAIWAIDLTVTKINKKLYAVWSGWESNASTDKTPQHLYIAQMSNPWTISSPRIKISSPEQAWETGGPLNLNEGPEFLQHEGNTFIIYSTRESWMPEYRLGQLRLINPQSPMDPASWEKKGPVFQGTPQVIGTGHASFTTSPNGREWWIFYHSKKSTAPGWSRDVRLQKFDWNTDGSPNFGTPLPAGTPIPLPGGETP